ncbi:hypothetical protein ACWE42_00925 [Sutcliffiella cohnii]|uniref:Uncharacterized protein n=1 Tax=Sutcliffiella cohnii TaxID=33932 RepID=A0A223KRT4_9BACI|nr:MULTISPECIES: hypothetical protein [Sutcliffiella]AST92201.1 hypothetical protein BC6307_13355 [Sutcliffiella cohnii]MED4015490.1 hypothetical protein [Sutcliffiella cohnii]WBL13433.1 hypothetical protein O1A01_16075 [Sutcliffiella sp. NC1]
MEQVMKPWKKKTIENRRSVLKLEIDYELATLYEALELNDVKKIRETKTKLKKLQEEMSSLQEVK